jgi:hypothetical protein
MGVAEVEGFKEVGRGLTYLIRLWKRVEKSSAPMGRKRGQSNPKTQVQKPNLGHPPYFLRSE